MLQPTIIRWEEPNREQAPPLHFANRGARYPTLTGVAWLSEFEFVVVHRCGFRLAVFDTRLGADPVCMSETPHRADDVAAKEIGSGRWEVAVSGCYDAVCTTYVLELGRHKTLKPRQTLWPLDRTFSHGIKYDPCGKLCISFHTGEDPRIAIAGKVWRIPKPWGARNVCFDRDGDVCYAVAVSHNPQLAGYEKTATSIWALMARRTIGS